MNAETVPQVNEEVIVNDLRRELFVVGELTPIAVKEARRIMGSDADCMSDIEVETMIYNLTAIARSFVRSFPKYETFI